MTKAFAEKLVDSLNGGKENPRYNYSGNGFGGKLYDPNLSITDIAKRVRAVLKERYPECTFSITTEKYSMGRSMAVRLMKAPFAVFASPEDADGLFFAATRGGWLRTTEDVRKHLAALAKSGHTDVNHFYVSDAWYLTEKAREVMTSVNKLVAAYNYDDSDAMTDYFHTNFYFTLGIGRWDKAFVMTGISVPCERCGGPRDVEALICSNCKPNSPSHA